MQLIHCHQGAPSSQPAQLGTTLAARLSVIPVGRLVLIGVYDSGFNSSTNEWNEAAYSAMEKLGAPARKLSVGRQKIRRLGFRDSYALVTLSGSPHNTIELHKKYVQRTSTSAECGIGTRIRPQATVQYRYNANGQRIYKQVGSNPAEHYILDEDQVLGVFKGAGLLYWNIYGNDGVVGRLEVSIPPDEEAGEGAGGEEPGPGAPQKLFYLKDHLGSTRAVMNTNGAVVETYDYYPFGLKMPGRIYPATPTVTKNLFTGKELDGETGWYQFPARPFHPALGRWLTTDPLEEFYSPYIFVGNNPVILTDPTGLATYVDSTGNVLYVDNKGTGIYQYNVGSDYSGAFLQAAGKLVGHTLHVASFADQDLYHETGELTPAEGARIDIGSTWAAEKIVQSIWEIKPQESADFFVNYAPEAYDKRRYDIKGNDPYYGSQITEGVYVSARDAGNILAGMVASFSGLSYSFAMSGFGALQQGGNDPWAGLKIFLSNRFDMSKYPYFGERRVSHWMQSYGFKKFGRK